MTSTTFRQLHGPGQLLVLPNASDAGSARLIESCGATAIATTSAGLAWSHGYPDGDALPLRILTTAVAEIARAISIPLSVDIEGGYSDDPRIVAETVAAVIDAGGVGLNIEDGTESIDLLCEKIAAAKSAAARAGVDVFVNARTDVYLRKLVPSERAMEETVTRAQRYRGAGCDSVFVPGVAAADAIRSLVQAIDLPINVLVWPKLPPVAELRRLGVRRLSAGSTIALTAYAGMRRATTQLLQDGVYDTLLEGTISTRELNQLMVPADG